MRLTGPQLSGLLHAMGQAYDYPSLQLLLKFRFDLGIHLLTGVGKRGNEQMFDVVEHFQQRNTTEQLIAALRDARPEDPVLAELADQAGFAKVPVNSALQALVSRPGQPWQDVESFRAELSKREAAVCRVQSAHGTGTGFLVGDDLVLTNHHVVAKSIAASGGTAAIECRFDHKRAANGYMTPAVTAKVMVLVASSPHAREDLDSSQVNVDPDRLDYALLKIDNALARKPIVPGGSDRGAIPIGGVRDVGLHEGLVVLQHPLAEPMKIDIGATNWIGATRVRHSVNTESGSSGAPIFDGALNLVALHHAGHDWPETTHPFNQAIPMSLILAHARAQDAFL